jgi:hypothetical protein
MRRSQCSFNSAKIWTLTPLVWLLLAGIAGESGLCQRPKQTLKSFPLLNGIDGIGCRAKGRLQDPDYCRSEKVYQILAQGKDAVPVLISQLTDTRELKDPAFDYWNRMTVGDLANAILFDLFTDSDWTTFNMPELEQIRPKCGDPAETCWHLVVKKHGMKFVQNQWLAAWNKNKSRVYWNSEARCFRLSPESNRVQLKR